MERKTTIIIGTNEYDAELGTIHDTKLGREDHGIFAISVTIAFGGSFQGAGGFSLDVYVPELEHRMAAAAGAQVIIDTVDTVGADSWETLAGRDVFALRKQGGGSIIGLAHPTEERYMIYEDLLKNFTSSGALIL